LTQVQNILILGEFASIECQVMENWKI